LRSFNCIYKDLDSLKVFIEKNAIEKTQNILIQIFTSVCDEQYILDLVQKIKTELPQANIIGATTDGEVIESSEILNDTVVSFSLFEQTKIKIFHTDTHETGYLTAQSLINQFPKNDKAKVAISFADGLHTDGDGYLKCFEEQCPELIVSGGLAADGAEFVKTLVFTQEKVLSRGAVIALLYNEDLIVSTTASFGWDRIGKKMCVTKAKGNVVYTIDGTKAVDIYANYLGENVAKELPKTGIEFPLIIRKDGSDLARAVIGKNDDGSLVFAGRLSEGDSVYLGFGNIENIVNNRTELYDKLYKQPMESMFVYSCMARKSMLGQSILMELNVLKRVAPYCGFFTYGEFYTKNNGLQKQLLNQNMTILGISENVLINKRHKERYLESCKNENKTLRALSHLISQTSKELEDINSSLESRVKKELDKNRKKDKHMLRQSRLAQMGEMISMIAHQWRQPLNAISATSSGLNIKAKLANVPKDLLIAQTDKISSYSKHLSQTIDDFRNFFKPNKEKIDVNFYKIMESVFAIVETSLINKNIVLIKEFNDNETFKSYPNELKQVSLNLIKNAEDILMEKMVKKPTIRVSTEKKNTKHYLHIRDNGGGIDQEVIEKIFEPYFSTKRNLDGTGLGLYMSKIIIEEHCGGKIYAKNDKDGAVFTIEIKALNE